ncbi:MAG: DUF4956 domain-containing protein [Microbacteriaceae bacterium]
MNHLYVLALDLVAISILVFGLYFPRHRRRDLVVAYLGVNAGVVAVSAVLGSATIGAGVGLGLFGVLSIIRLRSYQIEQTEVAYYFAALSLGLVAGLSSSITWVTVSLMVLLLVVMFVADHPKLFARYEQGSLTLPRAYLDETELRAELELVLAAKVHRVTVTKLNLVNNTTAVDVRFERIPGRVPQLPLTAERIETEAI